MAERSLTWSYGGGTQSVAIAVLVAQGKLPKPECVAMADTGREASETWQYTERYVKPMLAGVGVTLYVVNELEYGELPELYGGDDDGTLLIPAYSQDGAQAEAAIARALVADPLALMMSAAPERAQ